MIVLVLIKYNAAIAMVGVFYGINLNDIIKNCFIELYAAWYTWLIIKQC